MGAFAQTPAAVDAPKLWYRQPAKTWNEALPVGNGRLAAMVFGDPLKERIQLNEDTVWAGERRDRLFVLRAGENFQFVADRLRSISK